MGAKLLNTLILKTIDDIGDGEPHWMALRTQFFYFNSYFRLTHYSRNNYILDAQITRNHRNRSVREIFCSRSGLWLTTIVVLPSLNF